MPTHTDSNVPPNSLMLMRNNLIMHQGLYAAAKLGIPDLLERRPSTAAELASELKVHEESLYRTLRALASQGVFEETASGTFQNTDLSRGLLSGAPGALRPFFIFWGTELYYRSLGEILHSIESGQPAREKLGR